MKQIIYTAAAAALFALTVATSCSKDEPETPIPAEITFAPDIDDTPIDSETGTKTISFASTQPWTAAVEEEKAWCTIALATTKAAASVDTKSASTLAGGAGENVAIIITTTANNTYDDRTATITIISDKVTKEFIVTQSGATPPTPVIDISDPAGKEVEIEATLDATTTVTFNSLLAAWTATVKSEDAWCLIEGKAAGEKGSKQTITLKASSANTAATPCTATLTITPVDGTPTELTVTQKGTVAPTGDLLLSISAPNDVKDVANGTTAENILANLPTNVDLVTDGDPATANVTWETPALSEYNPATENAQTFAVKGTVILPEGVVNTNNVSLEVSVNVTVVKKEILPTDDLLLSISALDPITGVANGTSTANILANLPTNVALVTDGDPATATVTWETPSLNDYNPATENEQTFDITGTVTLPEGVVNTNDVSLTITMQATVKSKGISGGDLEEGGDW